MWSGGEENAQACVIGCFGQLSADRLLERGNPGVPFSDMNRDINAALDVLVGKPLWSSGRAADLQWFSFGDRKATTNARGEPLEVGEYALHVQCSWRIRRGDKVIVARPDLYHSAQAESAGNMDFDDEAAGMGGNRRDARISELFRDGAEMFPVQRIEAGAAGNFSIFFDGELVMEVFPDDLLSDEHWRFFKPRTREPHIVCTGSGVHTE